jgi:hypothetical protein
MSLTTDNCGTEFTEAMRPIAGDNVDLAPVQANLGALGLAVLRIATVHAETESNSAADAAFWQWVSATHAWMQAMNTWRSGVSGAFAAWAAATPAEIALKGAIAAVPAPPAPPAVAPALLKGRVL